jgi:hypothetical protein
LQCSCSHKNANVNLTEDVSRSLPQLSPGLHDSNVSNDLHDVLYLPSQLPVEMPESKGVSPINIDRQKQTPVYMFSDTIGKGLGYSLKQEVNWKIVNLCSPGLTYDKMIDKILNSNIKINSDVVVFCGDNNGVKKRHLTICITKLLKFCEKKTVIVDCYTRC